MFPHCGLFILTGNQNVLSPIALGFDRVVLGRRDANFLDDSICRDPAYSTKPMLQYAHERLRQRLRVDLDCCCSSYPRSCSPSQNTHHLRVDRNIHDCVGAISHHFVACLTRSTPATDLNCIATCDNSLNPSVWTTVNTKDERTTIRCFVSCQILT